MEIEQYHVQIAGSAQVTGIRNKMKNTTGPTNWPHPGPNLPHHAPKAYISNSPRHQRCLFPTLVKFESCRTPQSKLQGFQMTWCH